VDVNVKNGYIVKNFVDSVLADHMSMFCVQSAGFLKVCLFLSFCVKCWLIGYGLQLTMMWVRFVILFKRPKY
jgi:hypothetical protein